jgi:hypothetical protein
MTASGQDSIENSNDGRMRRKEEPQAQLPVKFHQVLTPWTTSCYNIPVCRKGGPGFVSL